MFGPYRWHQDQSEHLADLDLWWWKCESNLDGNIVKDPNLFHYGYLVFTMDFPYTWPDTPFAHGPTLFSHMARHSFRPMDLVVRVDFGLLSFVVPTTSYYTTSTSQVALRREISVDRNLLRDRHPLASTFPAKAPGHR